MVLCSSCWEANPCGPVTCRSPRCHTVNHLPPHLPPTPPTLDTPIPLRLAVATHNPPPWTSPPWPTRQLHQVRVIPLLGHRLVGEFDLILTRPAGVSVKPRWWTRGFFLWLGLYFESYWLMNFFSVIKSHSFSSSLASAAAPAWVVLVTGVNDHDSSRLREHGDN